MKVFRLRNPFRREKVQNATNVQTSNSALVQVPPTKVAWQKPEASFNEQSKAFEQDALLRQTILYQSAEVTGNGMFLTGSEYATTFKLDAKTALDEANLFNERIDMDAFASELTNQVIAFGNFWIDIEDIENPKIVPIRSIERIDSKKNVLVQTSEFGGKELPLKNFIHGRWHQKSGQIIGIGIVEPLIICYEDSPNILKTLAHMRGSSVIAFDRFAGPNELWIIPNHPKEKIEKLNDDKTKMPASGDRYFTNAPGAEIKSSMTGPAQGWETIQDMMFNQFLLSSGNPYLRSLMTPSFSPATVEAVQNLHQFQIEQLKRIVRRVLENLISQYLKHLGFDPIQSHIRLNWGKQTQKTLTLDDILRLYDATLIDRDEARKNLQEIGVQIQVKKVVP